MFLEGQENKRELALTNRSYYFTSLRRSNKIIICKFANINYDKYVCSTRMQKLMDAYQTEPYTTVPIRTELHNNIFLIKTTVR